MRLDSRDTFPHGMQQYLDFNGWHFSKRMAAWAASKMYREENGVRTYITPYTKERVDDLLAKNGLSLRNAKGYDCVYVANMCAADFFGSSVPDEMHLAKYVKDVIDDADSYEGMPFTRFYADCIGSGTPIPWEDVL